MATERIDPKLISLRDISEQDIPLVLNYWYRSPPGYIESMGVDPAKLPSETLMEKGLRDKCRQNLELLTSKSSALVILYKGQPIGVHTLFPVTEGDSGIFHAHIWNPDLRRRGLAMHTYPMACQRFMRRFNLKRILFKTPAQNIGAIRVKQKLGIRQIGEEVIGFGIIEDGTLASVFELICDEVDA